MRLFGVFGNPISHSRSPIMHNAALQGLGLWGCYGRFFLKDGAQLRQRFLELGLWGANITVPHKEHAFAQADRIEGAASCIQAVNTWVLREGQIVGYNTDAPGFMAAIAPLGSFDSALVLGAGGTARAVVAGLLSAGIKVTLLNRSAGRLGFFKELGIEAYTWDEYAPQSYDLLINTTSAGLGDLSLPLPGELLEALFAHGRIAVDVVYGKPTPFLQEAQRKGLRVQDGREMLLQQGALAFGLFTQGRFGHEEILKWMRGALALME